MSRRMVIIAVVIAIVLLCPLLLLKYSPYTAWRNVPFAKGKLHSLVLGDATLVGSTKSEILDKLGEPTSKQGPYSWWSLIDRDSPEQERSALMFHYDDSLSVIRVTLYNAREPDDRLAEPTPMNLTVWKNESYEVKHRMNIDLANKSEVGEIPEQLSSLRDVENYFPRARYVDHWNYTTGFFQSIAMSFDRNNIVTQVWEGND